MKDKSEVNTEGRAVFPPTPAPEVKEEDYPHSEEVCDLKNIIRSLEEQRDEYRLLFDKWTALAGETGVLFGWQDFWKECKALKIKYPTAPTEPVKDNLVERKDGYCKACGVPQSSHGTACGWGNSKVPIDNEGVIRMPGHPHDGEHFSESYPIGIPATEQLANVSDKERRLAIGFTIWATEQGWLLDPDSEEDEEPDFYKPSDDFDIPDDRMFGGQLYDLYLQHLNGSEMPPTAEHPTHVRDTQNVLWNEIRREMTGQAFSFPRPDIVDECMKHNKLTENVSIYSLVDPRTNKPFYVGATRLGLNKRLVRHLSTPNKKGSIMQDKWQFMQEIIKSGNRPIICLLKEVNMEDVNKYESLYYKIIKSFLKKDINYSN